MILPALLLLLTLVFSLFAAVTTQVRCREVAASIARAIERGEPQSTWRALSEAALPDAQINVQHRGAVIVVHVSHSTPLRVRVGGDAVALP